MLSELTVGMCILYFSVFMMLFAMRYSLFIECILKSLYNTNDYLKYKESDLIDHTLSHSAIFICTVSILTVVLRY